MSKKKQNVASKTDVSANLAKKPAAPSAGNPKVARRNQENADSKSFWKQYSIPLVMAAIAAIIFFALRNCLDNQFTNWDDPGYIKDNALIKDISANGIHNIFVTPVMGNFHPLTILTYALEYNSVRLEPYLYHRDSLLLHILTSLLFFWMVWLLTKNILSASFASLLFGLHPMHMESVAWIAARKDVLYGAFYAASAVAYIYYVRRGRQGTLFYLASLVLFLCSILSKPVAVSLPLVLLLIDYYTGRPVLPGTGFKRQVYLDKVPYIAISVAFGIRSLLDQKNFKALNTLDVHFNVVERAALGAYAFVTYLWKAVVPVGMSNFYPYPVQVNNALPIYYYLYPLAMIALLFVLWRFFRQNKVVLFGSLFFLVNIALLLQFIPVGGAILADRYTYVPYLGLFFIPAYYAGDFVHQHLREASSKIVLACMLGVVIVFGAISSNRCSDWYDTISLWKDEVVKHPDVPSAYNNLGFEYFNRGNEAENPKIKNNDFDSAVFYLSDAVRLQPNFVNPYVSLGEVARSRNNFPEAKRFYYKALSLSKSDETHNAYLGLAIIYCITGQQAAMAGMSPSPYFDSAQFCFRTALQVKPYFPEAHSNYGNFFDMIHNFDSSLKEYTLSIEQNPDMYASYLNRARLLQRHNRCNDAYKDFARAIEADPQIGEIYYSRSFCYAQSGQKQLALKDVEQARSLGFSQIDPAYYQSLKSR